MQSLEALDQQITLLVVSYVCLMKADVKHMRLCNVGGVTCVLMEMSRMDMRGKNPPPCKILKTTKEKLC